MSPLVSTFAGASLRAFITALGSGRNYVALLSGPTSNSVFYSVGTDANGGVAAAGFYNSGAGNLGYLARLDSSGQFVYQANNGNTSSAFATLDSSGNIYTATSNGNTGGVARLFKMSSTGSVSWERTLTLANGIGGGPVVVAPSGNVYALYPNYNGGTNPTLVKYNSSGVIQWQIASWTNSTSLVNYYQNIFLDSSENVYVSGFYISGNRYVRVWKFNSSGTHQWNTAVQQTSGTSLLVAGVVVDTSGNSYVSGYTSGPTATITKLDSTGAASWQRTFAPTSVPQQTAMAIDSLNNIYCFFSNNLTNSVTTVVKYNSSGTIQWQRDMSFTTGTGFSVRAATADSKSFTAVGVGPNGQGMIIRLPLDGSLTGSYTVGSYTFGYAAASGTDASATATTTTVAPSTGAAGATDASGSDTWSANAHTITTKLVP